MAASELDNRSVRRDEEILGGQPGLKTLVLPVVHGVANTQGIDQDAQGNVGPGHLLPDSSEAIGAQAVQVDVRFLDHCAGCRLNCHGPLVRVSAGPF